MNKWSLWVVGDDLCLPCEDVEFGWVKYCEYTTLVTEQPRDVDILGLKEAFKGGWRIVSPEFVKEKNPELYKIFDRGGQVTKFGCCYDYGIQVMCSQFGAYGAGCIIHRGLILMERSLHIKSPIASEKMTKVHEEKVNSLTYEIYKFKSRVEKLTESHNAIRKNLIEASERADEMSELMENEWIYG